MNCPWLPGGGEAEGVSGNPFPWGDIPAFLPLQLLLGGGWESRLCCVLGLPPPRSLRAALLPDSLSLRQPLEGALLEQLTRRPPVTSLLTTIAASACFGYL